MNLRDLSLRLRAPIAPQRVERGLQEELAFHIECETRKHIAAGLNPADARTRARASFGPVPLAADRCRDARGTRVFDVVRRDLGYAWRTFRRAPLATFTIVATVAVGLGLVAVVFTVYDMFFLRVDAVRRPAELFGVERFTTQDDEHRRIPFTRADYDAMQRETSVFTETLAMQADGDPTVTRLDGRPAVAVLVTGNFFQVLGAQAAMGRPLLPEVSEALARQLWPNDRAVGKMVRLEGNLPAAPDGASHPSQGGVSAQAHSSRPSVPGWFGPHEKSPGTSCRGM